MSEWLTWALSWWKICPRTIYAEKMSSLLQIIRKLWAAKVSHKLLRQGRLRDSSYRRFRLNFKSRELKQSPVIVLGYTYNLSKGQVDHFSESCSMTIDVMRSISLWPLNWAAIWLHILVDNLKFYLSWEFHPNRIIRSMLNMAPKFSEQCHVSLYPFESNCCFETLIQLANICPNPFSDWR